MSIDKQVLCSAQIEVPVALALASPALLGPNCLRVKLQRSGHSPPTTSPQPRYSASPQSLRILMNLTSLFAKRDLPQSQTLALPNDFAHKAFQKCKELGIDPYGKAPKDFDWDDGKAISFKAESYYALWIAAQNARTDHGNTKRGVKSNIDVVLWIPKIVLPVMDCIYMILSSPRNIGMGL
ncbi:hypothetical protein BDD12DRAFT_914070 [Trichophaea hybrida]|nr:hypothetical protein BDD12DRAFT_914070 [Trichophaea hybrida]